MSSQNKIITYPPIFTKDGERVYRLGEPESEDPRNIKVQDYQTLRNEHLAKKILFRDTEFQPYSLKYHKYNFKWLRPNKISKNPIFRCKEYTRFDVKQGGLGDCWFVSALSVIAMEKNVIKQVIPSGQSFAKGYAGIFRFRFWQYGKCIEVVVDDRLPTVKGNLYYVCSRSKNIFWSALLEKAYAKLYGGYDKIEGGHCVEAFSDFTGGVCELIDLENLSDNIYSMILKSHERGSLLCTGTANDEEDSKKKHKEETEDVNIKIYIEEKSIATICDNDYVPGEDLDSDDEAAMYANFECDDKDGDKDNDENTNYNTTKSKSLQDKSIVGGHAYSLTAVRYVTTIEEGNEINYPLIRIRNPWGRTEWSGRWSDKSFEWNTVSKEEKSEIDLLRRNDGEFWMHYDDFIKRFKSLYICHWKYDHLVSNEGSNNRSWSAYSSEGEFTEVSSDDEEEERLAKNTKYVLNLTDPDEDDDDDLCTLVVSLQNKYFRISEASAYISFSIYKSESDGTESLSRKFFKYNEPVVKPGRYVMQKECSGRYRLPPGTYYIIPNALRVPNNSKFYFRVITEKQCTLNKVANRAELNWLSRAPVEC